MVPSAFVALERLPLTASGKLDRRALPAPELEAYSSRQYEAPQGEVEEILAGVWQSLLAVERVGRHDNFFELGGHSLLAMQAIVRVRSALSVSIPISTLFRCPTPAQFAVEIDHNRRKRSSSHIASAAGLEGLLGKVASMSDSKVRELMRELKMEGRL